jgi:hypothetical protein
MTFFKAAIVSLVSAATASPNSVQISEMGARSTDGRYDEAGYNHVALALMLDPVDLHDANAVVTSLDAEGNVCSCVLVNLKACEKIVAVLHDGIRYRKKPSAVAMSQNTTRDVLPWVMHAAAARR